MSGKRRRLSRRQIPALDETEQEDFDDSSRQQHWTQDEAKRFFEAFQQHGVEWNKVSQVVRSKSVYSCESLYRKFRSFLSLPRALLNVTAFLAVVKDSLQPAQSGADRPNEGSDRSEEEVDDEVENRTGRSRSAAAAQSVSSDSKGRAARRSAGVSRSPVWGTRRPRAPQQRGSPPSPNFEAAAPRRAKSVRSHTNETTEPEDALGIDALLSLAAVAQEASQEQGKRVEARPSRAQRQARRAREEDDANHHEFNPKDPENSDWIPPTTPSRRRQSSNRAAKAYSVELPVAHTPSSRSRRERARLGLSHKAEDPKESVKEDPDQNSSPSRALQSPGAEDSIQEMPRTRRQASTAGQEEYRPQSKRNRRADALRRPHRRDSLSEANLEAEKEDLEEEEDDLEFGWTGRPLVSLRGRRRRKSNPERAPPMMASAKSLLARKGNAASSTTPPAFLLGVPPTAAQINAVETEGQTSMGPAELRLRHCLDPRVRRLCAYEFFYSALDRPWFMRNELVDYLTHIGIPLGTKLMRPELAIIRASLGRPRRLSLSFLRQERIKLELWRERVRERYVSTGTELPAEFPRQLQVGQKVTGRHPVTRQLHDGDVLTAAANNYRVQFERRELGVELVKDVDVMPTDPADSLPAAMQQERPLLVLNGRQAGKPPSSSMRDEANTALWGDRLKEPAQEPPPLPAEDLSSVDHAPSAIRTLADMKAALDSKEILLGQLKKMNDEVDAGMHKEVDGQRPEAFQKAYAQILVDLQTMNKLLDNSSFIKQLPNMSPASNNADQQGQTQDSAAKQGMSGKDQDGKQDLPDPWHSIWQQGCALIEAAQAEAGPFEKLGGDPLLQLVTGCVCMLIAIQQCSESKRLMSRWETAVKASLQFMIPHSDSNSRLYSNIEMNVAQLSAMLL